MLRCFLWAIAAAVQPKALLMADNLPPATATGAAGPHATSAPERCGPAFLDFGVSVVQRLANLSSHRKARIGAAVAPAGLARVLAPAFTPSREAGPPTNCAGTADPHQPDEHGESALGSAEDPGGAGEAWVQSLSQNGRQVYATNPWSRAIFSLAVIPQAARLRDLGVRLLLRPNDHVSNAVRVLRDPSRQPAGSPRPCDAESHRLVGGSANGRMLRLGSQAATISRS